MRGGLRERRLGRARDRRGKRAAVWHRAQAPGEAIEGSKSGSAVSRPTSKVILPFMLRTGERETRAGVMELGGYCRATEGGGSDEAGGTYGEGIRTDVEAQPGGGCDDLAERPDVDGVAKGISDEDPQVPVPRPRRALFTAVLCSLHSVK